MPTLNRGRNQQFSFQTSSHVPIRQRTANVNVTLNNYTYLREADGENGAKSEGNDD